jgi:hypothetical protein
LRLEITQERLNKEIRGAAIIRLVGAVLAGQNDEWTEARRYMGLEILEACRKADTNSVIQENTSGTELTISAIPA